jgi:hypothetical protein
MWKTVDTEIPVCSTTATLHIQYSVGLYVVNMYSVIFTSSKYMQGTLYLFCTTNDNVRVPYINEVLTKISFIIFQILTHHIMHIKAHMYVEISDVC